MMAKRLYSFICLLFNTALSEVWFFLKSINFYAYITVFIIFCAPLPSKHFFCHVVLPERTALAKGCFSALLYHTQIAIRMSQFNSWVAGARERFLPKETQQQPGTAPRYCTWNLVYHAG